MILFVKSVGCKPCSNVKDNVRIQEFAADDNQVICMDLIEKEEKAQYVKEYNLKTVPTLVDLQGGLFIADSAKIINYLQNLNY